MSIEESIKELKATRTQLKTRVTVLSNKIKTSSDKQSVVIELEAIYDKFCEAHYEYDQLTSDEQFEQYRIVSNLTNEQYFTAVNGQYEQAIHHYKQWHAQSCINQSRIILSKAKGIIAVQGISSNQDYVFSIITQCDDVLSNLIGYNSESKYDANIAELSDIITKLNTIVVSIPKRPSLPQARDSVNHINNVPIVPVNDNGEGSGNGQEVAVGAPGLEAGQPGSASGSPQQVDVVGNGQDGAAGAPGSSEAGQPSSASGSSQQVRTVSGPQTSQTGTPQASVSVQNTFQTIPSTVNTSMTAVTQVSQSMPQQRPVSRAGTSVSALGISEPPRVSTMLNAGYSHTSSIVSAYDKIPLGSVYSPAPNNPMLYHHDTNAYSHTVRPKRIVAPQPFSGNRKKWPEFKSTWIRYSSEFIDDFDRVNALKELLRGEASEIVASIYAVQPDAYQRIMSKLHTHYGDPGLCVDSVLADLSTLRQVRENDRTGLVSFVNKIEEAYCSLGEVGHIGTITMPHIDKLVDLLPPVLQREWMLRHSSILGNQHDRQFRHFMSFLDAERAIAMRWAEREKVKASQARPTATGNRPNRQSVKTFFGEAETGTEVSNDTQEGKAYSMYCVIHKTKNHSITVCKSFLCLDAKQRYDLVKSHGLCVKCLSKHVGQSCDGQECEKCRKTNHHVLLCRKLDTKGGSGSKQGTGKVKQTKETSQYTAKSTTKASPKETVSAEANHGELEGTNSVFPIQQVKVAGGAKRATIFFDGGSNATFITRTAVNRLGARRLPGIVPLDVTTLGNNSRSELTYQYVFTLLTPHGDPVDVTAYALDQVTSDVQELDSATLAHLFPTIDVNLLVREAGEVDILIGNDYFGLHPKNEVAKAGEHLSILKNPFGLCLQGSHPALSNITSHQPLTAHVQASPTMMVQSNSTPQHKELGRVAVTSCLTKAEKSALGNFIQGEELGVEVDPKCGHCRCGNCPIKGHTYSFKEEQELQMIQSGLCYDGNNKRWIASYPWLIDPTTLPDNFSSALATLRSTERTLSKDAGWAAIYDSQIKDMVQRRVARKLSAEELLRWKGAVYYLSHLAVVNPKSETTPVRIVFNSSQLYRGNSLNGCLAKGPDSYLNNLLGILLRWREDKVAVVVDISKMYNSIHTTETEHHTHRFLWRDYENRKPDVYIITRVNMGDRPAAAISSEVIRQTGDKFKGQHPRVAELLHTNTYVDDIVDSFPSNIEAEETAQQTDHVLHEAGFKIKCWIFSGENGKRTADAKTPEPTNETFRTQVLGVHWTPSTDQILFKANLNFSQKKRGVYTQPDLRADQVPAAIPDILTRRIVLEQTMKIFDPLGILSPFTFKAKSLLRETWSLDLQWDDPLPANMRKEWVDLFGDLFTLNSQAYDRSLKPEDAVGKPSLVILSDASQAAYGFSAYIRWALSSGKFWCRLIMAKCRIAPLKRISIPQMELNAAVLSKRGRKIIEKEMRHDFEKVYQLIDSETVLHMINKRSTRFKLYEGVRIGEIQSATNGDLTSWYWIPGESNTADWLTRGKSPEAIGPNSQWWKGPAFLYNKVEEWQVKQTTGTESAGALPGEKKLTSCLTAVNEPVKVFDYKRFKTLSSAKWVVARIGKIARHRSFSAGKTPHIQPADLENAMLFMIKDAQHQLKPELNKRKGSFTKLRPLLTDEGIWVVGGRLTHRESVSSIKTHTPALLPTDHPVTKLAMARAHVDSGHRGRDTTLARFREEFWTPHGARVASSAAFNCQMCKRKAPKLLSQTMAPLPKERLTPGPPFNNTMLDLFGPISIRGEVQKRTTGKAYGVLFTDMVSRAVHIEGVFGYDSGSFLMALKRFVSLRGWPQLIYSDPGSQLVGAEKEVADAWANMDKSAIQKAGTEHGTEWRFGPADSPWHQGAEKALIKSVKRCMKFSVANKSLTASEFSTACYEVSNMINERPLGTMPSDDSEISILTPNCLLIGRPFARNPGSWELSTSLSGRLNLVVALVTDFWLKWQELYVPTIVAQNKWFGQHRDLKVGDVVLVVDSNPLSKHYKLARVHEVFPGADGKVRRVALTYKTYKVQGKPMEYAGAHDTIVNRSVQRLALLVPVEDQ